MIDLQTYAWKLFLYGAVGVGELLGGYGILWLLRDRMKVSLWWSYAVQFALIGFIAFNVRLFWVF